MHLRIQFFVVVTLLAPLAAQDNVLIVIADDLGTDYVNVYGEGADPAPTPTLDALAGQGVLFRNAWANPTCSPTRASMHTGRYGYRTGVGSPGTRLPSEERTFAEQLLATESGYATGYFGKWHLGGQPGQHPNDQGWSYYAGMLGGGVGNYYAWNRNVNGVSAPSSTYTTTQIVDDALAWIGAQTGPWVCVVAFNAPHTPFHVPPAALHTQALPNVDPNSDPVPFYTAAIEAMDTEIGRLTTTLGTQLAQTNVIFFGDNGTPGQVSVAPFASNHAKGSPYEGGVGVPFIVSGPAVVAPGREETALVGVVDLFATVGDLTGNDLTPPFVRQDSVSFAPYLANPNQPRLRTVNYSEGFQDGMPDINGVSTARSRRFKLIRRYGPAGVASEEFYNLLADPFETNDLLPNLQGAAAGAYLNLGATIDEVRDRTGRFETLGTSSCAGSAGIPQIMAMGTPTIGTDYGVALTGAPAATTAWITFGLSDTFDTTFGLELPFLTSTIGGGAGCVLTTSLEVVLPAITDVNGAVTIPIGVPAFPQLIAGSVYQSWIVADPAAPMNSLGVTVTSGLRVIFGG